MEVDESEMRTIRHHVVEEFNGHDEKLMAQWRISSGCHGQLKFPVVVLTRLPDFKVSTLRPPTPQQFYSEAESQSSSESDMQWGQDGDSSDSDFAPANTKQKAKTFAESLSSSESDMQWEPDGDSSDSDFAPANAKQKAEKCSEKDTKAKAPPAPPDNSAPSTSSAASAPSADTTSSAPSTSSAASTSAAPPAPSSSASNNNNAVEGSPIIISSVFAHSAHETRSVRPNLPEVEIKVDIEVLARRRPMKWYQGKIVEVVEKEDGRIKYKVSFEEKGKSLVSGHHIALSKTPKLEELYVGARVVIRSQDNKFRFQPGVLCELPSRRNRLRFLVFLDDHTPVYVGLPLLYVICKPLENVLDDILEDTHRSFMEQYLKSWPYPHLTQYKVGQYLNALEGDVMRRCDVHSVDCSLMQVVFQESKHKEWIHRGSMRLEHISKFIEMKRKEKQNDESDK